MYLGSLSRKLTHELHMSKNVRALWRWPKAEAETCRSYNN